VRAVLHDRAIVAGDLAELLGRLNRLISTDHGGDRFMTMHISVIDSRTRTMRWVSAGHDPALIYDTALGTFDEIGEGELPLGIVDDTAYTEHCHGPLRPGQVIVIGTDGVWEMPDTKGEQFGKDRLREVIREKAHGSAEEVARHLRERLASFRGDARAVDDVTFVVIKMQGDIANNREVVTSSEHNTELIEKTLR
jgi:phosphoserine phosphatase RsbU/P